MASSRKSASRAVAQALAPFDPVGPDRPLAVAFSGGLDSTVLLDACCAVAGAQAVVALHVHHGLQAAADHWPAHCEAQARRLGARFVGFRIDGAPAAGDSVEAWARTHRYRLLLAAARKLGALALLTAHHADDQLETMLMAIGRGCGLDGLTGIAARDERDGVLLLRPLLRLSRADLAADARQRQLEWIEDPSNDDTALLRNAVRRRILPAIADVLPGLLDKLPDTIELLARARATIEQLAAADLAEATVAGAPLHELDRCRLAALPSSRQADALRAWIGRIGAWPPSRSKLDEMRDQLLGDGHRYGEILHDGLRMIRYRDRVLAWVDPAPAAADPAVPRLSGELPAPQLLRWNGEERLAVPGFGGWLCFEQRAEAGPGRCGIDADWLRTVALHIAPGRPAARLRPRPGSPSRTLKNLYQEHGIPASLRPWLPTVLVDGRLLMAAPFGTDRSGHWPMEASRPVTLRWQPASEQDPRQLFVAVQKV